MRIIFALGNIQDAGGPTKYAVQLLAECEKRGHHGAIVSYGFESRLPSGLRHLLYAIRLTYRAVGADAILAFDTMTVGLPGLLASRAVRACFAIRIGGDFVWEQYVERTGDLVKLSHFYAQAAGKLSFKERVETVLTRIVVRRADALMFNTQWQRELWQRVYGFTPSRAFVIENLFPARKNPLAPNGRVFVAAGRPIKLKQEKMLREIFAELSKRHPDVSLDLRPLPSAEHQERVAKSYAVILASVSDVSPNAIIDAVANGKPFICTDDTGIRERLKGVGAFVDTARKEAVAHAIESLLEPEEYARAQERVRSFSFVRTWDDVAEDFLRILTKLCVS